MEDFVPFELAKKLEGLGFDESSLFFYREDDEDKCVHCVDTNQPLIDAKITIAPTISQVLKWLRDEKKLHISIEYGYAEIPIWDFEIRLIGNYGRWWTDETYSSYEQAILAGIEYALDNLI